MGNFVDHVRITAKAGNGGNGSTSFHREKFVINGGPDGGDGGKGGDIIFEVDQGLNTLSDFRHMRKYCAQDGEEGGKRNCHGADGADLVIKVPEGTVIREADSGLVIADMSGENRRQIILKGGRGGKGNQHYATATMQAPKYAQPGQQCKELVVTLELKMIADVGLVGFPNVGKSTFLSRVTNARPKIANYHFTTLSPNLGVVDLPDGRGFVIADIPGIIEGASEGVGLGLDFLRHIERTRVIIHMVDGAGVEGRDPVEDIAKINSELHAYNEELASRPQVIAANKMDTIPEDEQETYMELLREAFGDPDIPIFPISAVSGKGVKELLYYVRGMLDELGDEKIVFEREYYPQDAEIEEPYSVSRSDDGAFVVEGPRIERMLGYTNLDSEKGFDFFQKFLKENGILKELEERGIKDGDTVRLYGLEFEYWK